MGAIEDFVFAELPLRPSLFKGAAATGDPRSSSDPAVNGSPLGTLFLQDDVAPKVTWQKQGPLASQWVVISGSFGKVIVERKLVVSSAFATAEPIDLVTGGGDASGAAVPTGDSVTIPADYITNDAVELYLNGLRLEKGVQIIHTTGKITINIPLDPADRIIVKSEEDL